MDFRLCNPVVDNFAHCEYALFVARFLYSISNLIAAGYKHVTPQNILQL